MCTQIIVATGLSRDFTIPLQTGQSWWKAMFGATKKIKALDEVTFTIAAGERVGLVGLNGSGKSTLLKLLTGVIAPSRGATKVLGFIPSQRRHAYLRRIGVMFGQKSLLFPDLTVMDALQLYRVIYCLTEETFRASLRELDDYLAVGRLLERPTRKLSLGERMRCEVIAALIHRPEVIFLDEPTIGMDVETRRGLAAFLESRVGPGQTLLLATHELGLLRRLSPRVMVMAGGRLVNDLPLAEVHLMDWVRLEVRYGRVTFPDRLQAALATARVVEKGDGRLVLDCPVSKEEELKRELSGCLDLFSLDSSDAPVESALEALVIDQKRNAAG